MEDARFSAACARAYGRFLRDDGSFCGIGRLGETTLHAALKFYDDPDPTHHEIPCDGFVADIQNKAGITEIQTKEFRRLRPKLEAFLRHDPVTVVCPLIAEKTIVWVEPETGICRPPRKSPKSRRVTDAFLELDAIRDALTHPNLRVRILLLRATDYRLLDGYGVDNKKRATKVDRVPTALLDEILLGAPADYRAFFPKNIVSPFSVADFARECRVGRDVAGAMLRVFLRFGFVRRIGKEKNAHIYEEISTIQEEKPCTTN